MRKLSLLFLLGQLAVAPLSAQQIKVSYTPSALNGPFSGHVLLYLSKDSRQPKDGGGSLEVFPCFSITVSNIKPGESIVFDDKAVSCPAKLSDIERATYYIQAVWDRNLGGRSIGASPRNIYSNTQKITITKDIHATHTIVCNQVIPEPTFIETNFVKALKAPSKLLSTFHHKEITVDAAVILPAEYYKQPGRKFPVLYIVSGYGGDYHSYSGDTLPSDPIDTIPCIWVYLDGNCPLGHSVYANSDNNGPWGDALTLEFIPLLEKKYRCNGARLLTGHSSGGWTVLWLQTHYPKVFAGCASSSPDPVDFRNFQQIDLYTAKNLFYAKDSSLNEVATVAGRIPWFSMKNICGQELVLYRGEQMHSFDAVFSKKGKDGNPESICDAVTGAVNSATFTNWQKYDISLYLRNNWNELKPDLDGKVRISVGKQDNFLLNYAVTLLESEMKKLNSTFQFAYYPGDHFTVSTKEYRKDRATFLEMKYLEWVSKNGSNN